MSGYGLTQRAPVPPSQACKRTRVTLANGVATLFEVTDSGIRVLVGVKSSSEQRIRAGIPSIAKRIANDNALIKDPAFQVKTCFIVPTSNTRFALWEGNLVLMLDPSKADSSTAAHEMGHAIFLISLHAVHGAPLMPPKRRISAFVSRIFIIGSKALQR